MLSHKCGTLILCYPVEPPEKILCDDYSFVNSLIENNVFNDMIYL